MKTKLKQILLQIFATKIGWLGISLLSVLVFGILSNYYDWAETAMFISWIYPLVLTVIMLVYALIVNPIREHKETKRLKQIRKSKEKK